MFILALNNSAEELSKKFEIKGWIEEFTLICSLCFCLSIPALLSDVCVCLQ